MKSILLKLPDEIYALIQSEKDKPYTQIYEQLGRSVALAMERGLETVVVMRTPQRIVCPECGSDNTARYKEAFPIDEMYGFTCGNCGLRWKSIHRFGYPNVHFEHLESEVSLRERLIDGVYPDDVDDFPTDT